MTTILESAHSVLGLRPNATMAEAKAAYRRLAMKAHPDREGGNAEAFKELQAALKAFKSSGLCPLCLGKGRMRKHQGVAAWDVPCPRCWKK